MLEGTASGLLILMGLISVWVGMALASTRLEAAGRAYRKTETLYETMPEGWASWFLGGFSGVAMGTHWLWAAMALAAWVMVAVCLIGLGFQVVWHA